MRATGCGVTAALFVPTRIFDSRENVAECSNVSRNSWFHGAIDIVPVREFRSRSGSINRFRSVAIAREENIHRSAWPPGRNHFRDEKSHFRETNEPKKRRVREIRGKKARLNGILGPRSEHPSDE